MLKRCNYLYYLCLLLIGCGMFVGITICEDGLWMIVVMILYSCILCLGQFPIYAMNQKKLKESFQITMRIQTEFETFWLDARNQELAVLCVFNPFKIQYIALDKIDDMSVFVQYIGNEKKYASVIYLFIVVRGKKHRIQLRRRGTYEFIDMEKVGNTVVGEAQKFISWYIASKNNNYM